MLQQTTVAAVAGYWQRFTTRWPTVGDLAAADDGDVMAAWAGLGYYARARNLLACARAVVAQHGGRFPDSEAELRALPGIGDYTAAAVAAIAFGRASVVVDANIERVVARHARIETPLPSAKAAIRTALAPHVPAARAGDFAQALMDLGAGICTVRSPRCDAWSRGRRIARRVPPIAPNRCRSNRRARRKRCAAALRAGSNRTASCGLNGDRPKGCWAGCWRCRATTGRHRHCPLTLQQRCDTVSPILICSWLLSAAPSPANCIKGQWWPLNALDAAGLPTLYRKAVDAMGVTQ